MAGITAASGQLSVDPGASVSQWNRPVVDVSAISLADIYQTDRLILAQLVQLNQLLMDWLGVDTPRVDLTNLVPLVTS